MVLFMKGPMDYTPHTTKDLEAMLSTVGANSLDALFQDLPSEILFPELSLSAPLSESEAMRHMRQLAAKNNTGTVSFLGGGLRAHYIPAVVPSLATRAEFITAYTPYQPEASQGLLQAIFEYQTMVSELSGLPVTNASMYDGSTALAEGVLLALRESGRMKALVSRGVHPEYRRVLKTYLDAVGAEMALFDGEPGSVLQDVGAVVAQNPDFLGSVNSLGSLAEKAHQAGALLVAVVDPLSLVLLKPPGEYGADIAVGEGQPLGNSLAFGGPHFGFISVRENLVRQLPGRLVSETKDLDGKRGFILTLQAREQYIRRSKAKSNITTNAQLTALMGAVYLAALGPEGLKEVALRSVANAHQLAGLLCKIPGVELASRRPFFSEFALRLPRPADQVRSKLAARGIHAAVPVPDEYGKNLALFATTEQHTENDLKALEAALREVLA